VELVEHVKLYNISSLLVVREEDRLVDQLGSLLLGNKLENICLYQPTSKYCWNLDKYTQVQAFPQLIDFI
jgi:hypothetical protein